MVVMRTRGFPRILLHKLECRLESNLGWQQERHLYPRSAAEECGSGIEKKMAV